MCAKRRSASCKKRRIFWRETHTPLWLLIGRVIFLTIWILLKQLFLSPSWPLNQYYILSHFSTWKNIVRDSDWTYHFFTCENHSSVLWLARTHLRIKIYNTTFWCVFLSMYIIKRFLLLKYVIAHRYWKAPALKTKTMAAESRFAS